MNKKTEINRIDSRIKTDKRHGLKLLVLLLLYTLCCIYLTGCKSAAETINAEISATPFFAETSCAAGDDDESGTDGLLLSGYPDTDEKKAAFLSAVPAYAGEPYIEINENVPYFTREELTNTAFEEYSPLDSLGRCGTAYACIGTELMPTEPRGDISEIRPTGWHQAFYPFVENEALYNRCHLIAFQLAGENANERNLITGTRYMNTEGMLYFEELVGDYVRETGYHVLYRVTPLFTGGNLLADGVLMEAKSIEDDGEGITFCIYAYNVQPGVRLDYRTGESSALDAYSADENPDSATESEEESGQEASGAVQQHYIINIHTDKFHLPRCSAVSDMKEENRREVYTTRGALLLRGYEPCKICNP